MGRGDPARQTYNLGRQPGRFSPARLDLPAVVVVFALNMLLFMAMTAVLCAVFFGWATGLLVIAAFVVVAALAVTSVRSRRSRSEEISDEH